ncbi:hypothetical protein R1flu_009703 [Riccia fluitans]|uniref:Diphthine--ammonia ligase n=1 Tax=Riccia fluitans TaxID=41844 RepID=A0ABD1Z2W3_9MARC
MKVVALVSGGKDSCHAMYLCKSYGHEIVALANLYPVDEAIDELDSYMYQTVGHQVISAMAQCVGLPLFRRKIRGQSRSTGLRYTRTDGDEVEDLEILLRAVKSRFPDLQGVSTGAIASDYQRLRVENVCSRLGLISLAYMWKQEQPILLQNMIDSGLHAVLVKVAAMGLDPKKHLGKDLSSLQPLFMRLQDLYGCNVCGEGGEYETLTLDSPVFTNARIILDEFSVELHSADSIAPVGCLHPLKFHLEAKSEALGPEMPSETMWEEVGEPPAPTESCFNACNGGSRAFMEPATLVQDDRISPKVQISVSVKRQRHGFVALTCCMQPDQTVALELQDELDELLKAVEGELQNENLSWADVIYVHLFLKDMTKFSKANEKYMEHITEKLCVRGVPSRSCVELPLVESGMGGALVEIIAAESQTKRVLHVQSISCWAPCCIGPYSQATLFQGLLYMAGQLGLDPPTMTLVSGGGAVEMLQALRNCEAVGSAYTASFLSSVMSFTVFCSSAADLVEREQMEDVLTRYLLTYRETIRNGDRAASFEVLPEPLMLYILVPALPKGALVEVAPFACVMRPVEEFSDSEDEGASLTWTETRVDSRALDEALPMKLGEDHSSDGIANDKGLHVQHGQRQYVCAPCKGLVLPRYFCKAIIHILLTGGQTRTEPSSCERITSLSKSLFVGSLDLSVSGQSVEAHRKLEDNVMSSEGECNLTSALSRSLYSLLLTLKDASLCWDDVIVFRVYFVLSFTSAQCLRKALEAAIVQLDDADFRSRGSSDFGGPRPTLIPVLGVGDNAKMQGVIGMELTASGSLASKL